MDTLTWQYSKQHRYIGYSFVYLQNSQSTITRWHTCYIYYNVKVKRPKELVILETTKRVSRHKHDKHKHPACVKHIKLLFWTHYIQKNASLRILILVFKIQTQFSILNLILNLFTLNNSQTITDCYIILITTKYSIIIQI